MATHAKLGMILAAYAGLLSAQSARPSDLSRFAYLPQIAAGGGWSTVIYILNTSDTAATGVLQFYDQQGTLLPFALADPPNVIAHTIQLRIGPNGSQSYTLAGTGPVQAGYAVLTRSQGRLSASLTLIQRVPGRPDFQASLPGMGVTTKKWLLPFDNTDGFSTAFAVVNPGRGPANYVFEFYDNTGSLIAVEALIQIPAGQQQAFSSPVRWPEVANTRGSVQISRTDVAGIIGAEAAGTPSGLNPVALQFNPTGAFSWIYMVALE